MGTVVLVHGMVVAGRGVLPLARALADRGFKVHVPDLPGFGRSDKPRRALSVEGLAAGLCDWMDATGVGGVGLLGNSFGTQVAAAAAGAGAPAARLVLLSPTIDDRFRRALLVRLLPRGRTSSPRQGRTGALRALRRALSRLMTRDLPPGRESLLRLIVQEYTAAGPARALSTYRYALLDDITGRMPEIRVPTLVVRGEADTLVSASWARSVAAASPSARLAEVPGADHDTQFHDPERVAEVVAPFLRHGGGELSGGRPRSVLR